MDTWHRHLHQDGGGVLASWAPAVALLHEVLDILVLLVPAVLGCLQRRHRDHLIRNNARSRVRIACTTHPPRDRDMCSPAFDG